MNKRSQLIVTAYDTGLLKSISKVSVIVVASETDSNVTIPLMDGSTKIMLYNEIT